jgi:hypothetical protein
VERRWARLKEWWAVATRYEKTAAWFSSEELHRSVSVFPPVTQRMQSADC